jgi:hypothetical protein
MQVYLHFHSSLVPLQSCSLPAGLLSVLDGVKSEIKAGEPGTRERRIGLTQTAIALLSSMNDEAPQVGDATVLAVCRATGRVSSPGPARI